MAKEMIIIDGVRYDGASRTITTRMISKFSGSTVPAPVVGAIPCGTPEEEEENIQEYVSLPVSLFGKGEFYILKRQAIPWWMRALKTGTWSLSESSRKQLSVTSLWHWTKQAPIR